MDKDHLFILSYVIVLGELFFFTVEGIEKNDETINQLLGDLYKNISFNWQVNLIHQSWLNELRASWYWEHILKSEGI